MMTRSMPPMKLLLTELLKSKSGQIKESKRRGIKKLIQKEGPFLTQTMLLKF